MAEKKEHKLISADTGKEVAKAPVNTPKVKAKEAVPAEPAPEEAPAQESTAKKPSVNVPQVKPKAPAKPKEEAPVEPAPEPEAEEEAPQEEAPAPKPKAPKAKAAAQPAPAETVPADNKKPAKENGNPTPLRIGAVVLWVVAFVFEILAVLIVLGKLTLPFFSTLTQLIILLVADLICVIIGSQLWKKANHIDPVSKQNKAKFWLWNNMGVIACVIAFVPIIIVMLTSKNLDKRTKVIATIVAIVALLIGGVASYDFNPVSKEELQTAQTVLGDATVYWAPFGRVYHTHEDCQALNRSDTLTFGTVDQAVAANRTRLCSFCARRDDITEVATDDVNVTELVVPQEEQPAA